MSRGYYNHESAEEEALFDARTEQLRHQKRMNAHADAYIADLAAGRICMTCGRPDDTQTGTCVRCEVVAERGREWDEGAEAS